MINIALILMEDRTDNAVKVQSILTENGDIIKNRLGINKDLSNSENATGFIFLELEGNQNKIDNFNTALNSIPQVRAKCLQFDLQN